VHGGQTQVSGLSSPWRRSRYYYTEQEKETDSGKVGDKVEDEPRKLPVTNGKPGLDDRKAGEEYEKICGEVKKFENSLEVKIQYKQKNIYLYFSVFTPNKKTLVTSNETLHKWENGQQCRGGMMLRARESLVPVRMDRVECILQWRTVWSMDKGV
jgi:hypothetical protein